MSQRFLLEAKDCGNDKRAWVSLVAHTEGVDVVANQMRHEYRNTFLADGEFRFNDFLGKLVSQAQRGMFAEGDSASFEVEGCTFSLSAIADTRH